MGILPNYGQYFGSSIVDGAAESWVEAKMSWVEVDGAWWRWVHGSVIPDCPMTRTLSLKTRVITVFDISESAHLHIHRNEIFGT